MLQGSGKREEEKKSSAGGKLEVVYNVLNVAALGKNTIKVEIRVVKFVLRIVLESTVVSSNLKTK